MHYALVVSISSCAAEPSIASLYDQVNSSVVIVYTIGREVVVDSETRMADEVIQPNFGSGVVIDEEGDVVTAAHLVQTADVVEVQFVDGSRSYATVIASDPFQDLALLKLDSVPKGIKVATLANSDDVRIGDRVFVIGTPYGFEHSLTGGYISGRHSLDDPGIDSGQLEFFQTDAAINQGNSGAPLFNLKGEVVGIASLIMSRTGRFEGLGFAISSNTVSRVLFTNRAFWSGMTGIMIAGEVAQLLNVPQESGYLVQRVAAGSPADRIGLREGTVPVMMGDVKLLLGGDLLLSIDGIDFSPGTMQRVRQHAASLEKGQSVTVRVFRAGKTLDLVGTF